MAYKGKVFANINRYGQETTTHVRRRTKQDRVNPAREMIVANATIEIANGRTQRTTLVPCVVHPDELRK